jgi:hypothetical protein
MKLTQQQKKLLADKYLELMKPKLVEALKDADIHDEVADLLYDNIRADAKLVGIKLAKPGDGDGDDHNGFASDEEMDAFTGHTDEAAEKAIAKAIAAIKAM